MRYALRQLRLNPGFTATAVLSLALGIGANTAIFTLVDQIMLRLLPVENPRELVQLRVEGGRFGGNNGDGLHTFSHPAYLALRDRNTVLAGLTGQRIESASLAGESGNEMISVGLVAGNFFQVLGVRPHLGRVFTPDDDRVRNGSAVAVLEHGFWVSRYASNPAMVGSTIRLNGTPFTVIGIAAPQFEGTDAGVPNRVWVPVTMKLAITPTSDDLEEQRLAWFYLFGRLKPGVSIDQAQASMRVLYRQRQEEELHHDYFQKFPETRDRFLRQTFRLVPASRGQSGLRNTFERPLIVLQWLVGVVLLIACTNVANLLIARGAARQREIAIRGALGASRGQLARQLFAESALLAVAGGAAGLTVGFWLLRLLIPLLPYNPANLSLVTTPDARILIFTAAVSMLTAVIFGLAPAWQSARVSPAATLKEEAGSITGGHGHVRLRKLFAGLQVGLSCLLLIGAGLFARTFQNLRAIDLGFRTEEVVTFRVRPSIVYDEPRKLHMVRTLIESLAGVPGVKAVGANTTRLLTGGRWDSGITLPGAQSKSEGQLGSYYNAVTPGYFDALGIPVKAGRDLRWSDWGSGRKLCLVNETLVSEYLGGAAPVGRLLAQGAKQSPDTEIIGVFGNARYDDVRGAIPRQTFIGMDSRIRTLDGMNVYARVLGDPRPAMARLLDQVRHVDPNLVVTEMRTLDEQVNLRLSNERLLSLLSVAFALLASLMAIVGLNGVLSFVVARRTREIGIRMALGAGRRAVVRLVLGEMLPVIAGGLAAGVAAGLLCGKFVETQLFGVKAYDAPVFAASIAALIVAALASAAVPAWRASRIDPGRSMRQP